MACTAWNRKEPAQTSRVPGRGIEPPHNHALPENGVPRATNLTIPVLDRMPSKWRRVYNEAASHQECAGSKRSSPAAEVPVPPTSARQAAEIAGQEVPLADDSSLVPMRPIPQKSPWRGDHPRPPAPSRCCPAGIAASRAPHPPPASTDGGE